MKSTLPLSISSLIATSLAATIEVTVGPSLSFSPDTVTAADGDIVSFTFGSGHDVTSGSFDSPCQPDGTIYSGSPNDGDVFSVTVNGTDPIWIYCSVPRHCQGGMAMVINAPSDHTIDDYKSAAANAGSSSAPDDVVGGVFGAVSDSSSSSTSSAAASETSGSATSAASSAAATSSGSSDSSSSSSGSSATSSSSSAGASSSSSAGAFLSGSAAAASALMALTAVMGFLTL